MTRIPVLSRDEMNADQQATLDRVSANNARVGFGPAIGYAYSAEGWRLAADGRLSPDYIRRTGWK